MGMSASNHLGKHSGKLNTMVTYASLSSVRLYRSSKVKLHMVDIDDVVQLCDDGVT